MITENITGFDAHGKRISNVAAGIERGDVATVGQLLDIEDGQTGFDQIDVDKIAEKTSGAGITFLNIENLKTSAAVTAFAGGGQGSATQLTSQINNISTCATAGDSVKLPTAIVGMKILVLVASGVSAPCAVFPATGATIGLLSANASILLSAGSHLMFEATSTTSWRVSRCGMGTNNGITAHAGGGQGSATVLSEGTNVIGTCATAGDSVVLPAIAFLGQEIVVKNLGAAALDIFPNTSASINALAVNLAVRIQPLSSARFVVNTTTGWQTTIGGAGLTFNSPSSAKGQLEILVSDSAGNTVTRVTNASQAAARIYTIPDAGADANFAMTQGNQTFNGIQTFGNYNIYKLTSGMTALAGGAQAGTAIASEINIFTTVATAGDSAQLPVIVVGQRFTIRNDAAKSMNVFGQTGDAIDGAVANAAFALQPGQEVIFEAKVAGNWVTIQGTSLGTISSVTQGTSITTGVTVNSRKGIITTFTPSTAALSATTFTVTCNKTTATSNIRAYITEYGGTVITNGLPYVFVKNQTANSFDIIIYNAHATNALSTSMKIGFEIIN